MIYIIELQDFCYILFSLKADICLNNERTEFHLNISRMKFSFKLLAEILLLPIEKPYKTYL